jgi:hypothetical protein
MRGEQFGVSWRSGLEGWEVKETGPGLCPLAVFGIMSVGPMGFVTSGSIHYQVFFVTYDHCCSNIAQFLCPLNPYDSSYSGSFDRSSEVIFCNRIVLNEVTFW